MTQALSAVLRGLFPPALPEQHSTWPVFPWPLLLTLISSTCFAVQFSSQKLACLCASFSRGKPRHKNVCSLSQGCRVAKNRSESMTLCHPRPPLEQLDTYAWACTGMARKKFFDPFFYLTEIENDMLWLRITEHKLRNWSVFEELENKSPRTLKLTLRIFSWRFQKHFRMAKVTIMPAIGLASCHTLSFQKVHIVFRRARHVISVKLQELVKAVEFGGKNYCFVFS